MRRRGHGIPSRVRGALVVLALTATACTSEMPGTASAVDHVVRVLADAGRAPAALDGLVRLRCGPTDAALGINVVSEPVPVDIAWSDVAAVVASIGTALPPSEENPLAGAPGSVDRYVTSADGRNVRWGESYAERTDTGAPTTVVTVVGGGQVTDETLRRWEDSGAVHAVGPCG